MGHTKGRQARRRPATEARNRKNRRLKAALKRSRSRKGTSRRITTKTKPRTISTSRKRTTRKTKAPTPKRATTRRVTTRRRTLTRATRKGASRVVGLRLVMSPTKTRTGGQTGARSRRVRTAPPIRRTSGILPRGGQGAAREGQRGRPTVNGGFVPRQGGDIFIPDEPKIESASFQGQAGDFLKENKLIVFGALGVVALLALRK